MSKITNPIVPGWYADPEARTYQGRHYIYVTRSFTEYRRQMNLDCFSSDDLEHWVKHEGIIQMEDFPHIYQAVWAPTEIEHQGRHYLVLPRMISIRTRSREGWRLRYPTGRRARSAAIWGARW